MLFGLCRCRYLPGFLLTDPSPNTEPGACTAGRAIAQPCVLCFWIIGRLRSDCSALATPGSALLDLFLLTVLLAFRSAGIIAGKNMAQTVLTCRLY